MIGPFHAHELKAFCIRVLTQLRVSPAHAEVVGDSLVDADSCGAGTHGIGRLSIYVDGIQKGILNPAPALKILKESLSISLLDGDNGLGQVVGVEAMKLAIQKARATGVGVVAGRNSSHLGRLAFIAQFALDQGLAGGVMGNTQPMMAPSGGKVAKIGNNPFAIAIPGGSRGPVILDMSCSVVAKGRIRQAAAEGESIPKTWALDEEGEPTDDPQKALKGVLLPFGGYKGYGIALLIEILAGMMTGAGYSTNLGTLYPLGSKPLNYGVLVFALDPAVLMPTDEFSTKLDGFLHDIKTPPFSRGISKIYVPGEPEREMKGKSAKEGVQLVEADYQEVQKVGQRLGIPVPRPFCSS